jgi:hypothetical protein
VHLVMETDARMIKPNTVTVMLMEEITKDCSVPTLPARNWRPRQDRGGHCLLKVTPCRNWIRKRRPFLLAEKCDLRKVKVGANVPYLVLEYLLGKTVTEDLPPWLGCAWSTRTLPRTLCPRRGQ